jgi:AcrR family transcriptional regulator
MPLFFVRETCKFPNVTYDAFMGRIPANRALSPKPKECAAQDTPLLRLIEAAEDIFLAKGYHTATMNDVAQAAGMSKKTVYTIIKSKAELFGLLLAHHESFMLFPEPKPEATLHEILVQNLTTLARFLIAPEQIAILRLIMAEYTHSPDLGKIFHSRRVSKAKGVLQKCMKNIADQHVLSGQEAAEYASMLFGMALGEFHLSVLVGYRAPPSQAAIKARINRAVAIFLAGCAAR